LPTNSSVGIRTYSGRVRLSAQTVSCVAVTVETSRD
jgi:hypothetical protein